MSVHVDGTVLAPAATYDRSEPANAVELGSVAPNTSIDVLIGHFVNQGNVDQTVTLAVANVTGGSVTGLVWKNPSSGEVEGTSEVLTLVPAQNSELHITVHTDDVALGQSNETLSLDVSWDWS